MKTKIVEQEVAMVVRQASGIEVTDPDSRARAIVFIRSVKDVQARVKEVFDPMVSAAHKAHKEATAVRAKFLDPLKASEATVKDKVTVFDREAESSGTEITKAQGEFTRKIWKGRVMELRKLPLRFLMADQNAIDDYAKETQGTVEMPGIEFYYESSLAVSQLPKHQVNHE